MERIPDYYYELTSAELLAAFRAGDVRAARAMIARFDGLPPDGTAGDRPAAVVWAEILTGQIEVSV